MIPAVYPMYARFEQPGAGDRKYHTAKRVLAWDDEGRALIASERFVVSGAEDSDVRITFEGATETVEITLTADEAMSLIEELGEHLEDRDR